MSYVYIFYKKKTKAIMAVIAGSVREARERLSVYIGPWKLVTRYDTQAYLKFEMDFLKKMETQH